MGGFVALELAELLAHCNRLSSLYLQATCAGLFPFPIPLGEGFWRGMLGLMGTADKTPEQAVAMLVDKALSKEFTADPAVRARVEKSMLATFDRTFTWTLQVCFVVVVVVVVFLKLARVVHGSAIAHQRHFQLFSCSSVPVAREQRSDRGSRAGARRVHAKREAV
jgi:hypothetical protein